MFSSSIFKVSVLAVLLGIVRCVHAAHASLSVHYPKATRGGSSETSYCGSITDDPKPFSAYATSFTGASGNVGDLFTVRYSRKSKLLFTGEDDFEHVVVKDVPFGESGQLCLEINAPRPSSVPEDGVFVMIARDPHGTYIGHSCHDVTLRDQVALASLHPAMCAKNNDTLLMMPDGWVHPNINP